MAVKQPGKILNNDRLSTGDNKSVDSVQVSGLFAIDIQGNIQVVEPGFFILNPSSWQDSKSANWAEQNVPGQSDPVLQWISGGPRVVTFEALVTNDVSNLVPGELIKKPGEISDPLKKAQTFVGNIAAKLFNIPIPTIRNPEPITSNTTLDISNYLNYYRSLLYPVYDRVDKPQKLRASPPLLVLFNGNSINKLPLGINTRISPQHDLWVLTDLQINITKQLPNLAPMEATVSFKLMQYNVRSFDRNRFLR